MRKREILKRQRRAVRQLPDTQQGSLFSRATTEPVPGPMAAAEFQCPDAERTFVGDTPLRRYLEENGLGWVIRLREELAASDLSALLAAYAPTGRRAIHPLILLGLIVYGMLERKWSLRELEQLARRDVGAWWMCGGLQPDHSTIGDFLTRHAAVLSEEYFVTLTRQLLRMLRLAPGTVAGDGTVIEAAASHYRLLKADAAREAAARAPEDAPAQAAAATATAREAERRARGDKGSSTLVSPTEPEAVSQPLKNGTQRPSYKPSVWATTERLVVGQHVQPSNEATALGPLLAQHQQLWQTRPTRLLLDANYHQNAVFVWAGAWDLDLLCPSGAAERGRWERKRGAFGKAAFGYDEERNVYVCSAGQELRPLNHGTRHDGVPYCRYGGAPCRACAQRALCTSARQGRTVKRFAGDEWKEAMAQVMRQPAARRAYGQRKAMVEPVFATLRERQGLTRFHRRGLTGVRLEFALHCLAYNLRRALRLSQHSGATGTRVFRLWRCPNCVAILIFVLGPSRPHSRLTIGVLFLLLRGL